MPGEKRKEISPLIFLLAGCLIYLFDRMTKVLAMNELSLSESVPVCGKFFYLTLVRNTGGAFGVFRTAPWFFVVVAILALISISFVFLSRYRSKLSGLEKWALVFIFAGVSGNLTDRILFGYVIDFLDFRCWPVFNVADSFITCGAAILVFRMFFTAYSKRIRQGEV